MWDGRFHDTLKPSSAVCHTGCVECARCPWSRRNEVIRMPDDEPRYDVALSFAGEDRLYVEKVAFALRNEGVKIFYDDYEKVTLWGRDLYAHLDWVYRGASRYCVVFISRHYAEKVWTNHERASAQARALIENQEYVLPARFDDTEVP